MKVIKIIDLLNKIANKEELPKKIKYHDVIYNLNENNEYISNRSLSIFMMNIYEVNLNDEVELLEEIDIQEIKELDLCKLYFRDGTELIYKLMYNKINEIIRVVNKMQETRLN